ncbi:hypothetical protein HAX54_038050, partial [Datura stramonium]|nr:hypothetical protein [Datura stramonium]
HIGNLVCSRVIALDRLTWLVASRPEYSCPYMLHLLEDPQLNDVGEATCIN